MIIPIDVSALAEIRLKCDVCLLKAIGKELYLKLYPLGHLNIIKWVKVSIEVAFNTFLLSIKFISSS